jgi:hypothetical protein
MVGAVPSTGWVYILTNPAMPGLVKIGLTTRTPTLRAAELSGATGVPLPYEVAWARAVSDCAFIEGVVHRMLDDRRINGKRESFRCDVATARQVIETAVGGKLGRAYKPAPVRRRSRRKGRGGRRDTHHLATLMTLSGVALVAILALFRPPLPDWLPDPVLSSFLVVESWH